MIDFFLLSTMEGNISPRLNEELKRRKIHSSQVFQMEQISPLTLRVWFRRGSTKKVNKTPNQELKFAPQRKSF